MSFSANKKKKIHSNNYIGIEPDKTKLKNQIIHKTYSPTHINNNLKLTLNLDSETTKNTNTLSFNQNKNKDPSYCSYPIKEINEDNLEKYFISKKKKCFKSPMIINYKVISFQKKKDKTILEFPLFDDKMIFKDLNKAYLQDEYNDNGDDSTEEKINESKLYLSQEIEQSIKELQINIKQNQKKPLLSRRIQFNNHCNDKVNNKGRVSKYINIKIINLI